MATIGLSAMMRYTFIVFKNTMVYTMRFALHCVIVESFEVYLKIGTYTNCSAEWCCYKSQHMSFPVDLEILIRGLVVLVWFLLFFYANDFKYVRDYLISPIVKWFLSDSITWCNIFILGMCSNSFYQLLTVNSQLSNKFTASSYIMVLYLWWKNWREMLRRSFQIIPRVLT